MAGWAPGARVVKAFNTTGVANVADPVYGEQRLRMPVCGDDSEAKLVVMRLAEELGFEAVDAGPLANSRSWEHPALPWIHLAYPRGLGQGFGLALVRREVSDDAAP